MYANVIEHVVTSLPLLVNCPPFWPFGVPNGATTEWEICQSWWRLDAAMGMQMMYDSTLNIQIENSTGDNLTKT